MTARAFCREGQDTGGQGARDPGGPAPAARVGGGSSPATEAPPVESGELRGWSCRRPRLPGAGGGPPLASSLAKPHSFTGDHHTRL